MNSAHLKTLTDRFLYLRLAQFSKSDPDIFLKIVPGEAKLFRIHLERPQGRQKISGW